MSDEIPMAELKVWAKKLDDYEAAKRAEAVAAGRPFPILDYAEHGVPPAIEAAIAKARNPARKRRLMQNVDAIRAKAKDAERFAALHDTKAEATRKEIAGLIAGLAKLDHLGKTKAEHAEKDRLVGELAKAERSLATSLRGSEKQKSEAVRINAEADAAEAAANEVL